MLVLCAGMYRACSTWQYAVVADLLEHHRAGVRLGYMTGDDFQAWHGGRDLGGEWHVLKSHEGHASFSRLLALGRGLVVYAYRDVRDVAYSLIHKRSIDFATLLRRGMLHQILVNDRYWSSRPGALIQRYEAMVQDPVRAVLELGAHVSLALGVPEAQALAREHSLEANKERTRVLGERLKGAGLDLHNPVNAQRYDPHTLLHWNHVRDGRVGDWRDRATAEELWVLDGLVGSWLQDKGYESNGAWAEDGRPSARRRLWWRRLELEGAAVCGLRCASSQYPGLARIARRLLGRCPEGAVEATPAPVGAAIEGGHAVPPTPHLASRDLAASTRSSRTRSA